MKTRNFSMALGAVGFITAAAITSPRWSATLASVDGSTIAGTATVDGAAGSMTKSMDSTATTTPMASESFTASVSITGAKPNEARAWHVHEGKCGGNGAIVGTDAAYPDIKADGKGAGQATATVTRDLGDGKEYSVMVHKGDTDETPAAACGDLRSATRTTVPER